MEFYPNILAILTSSSRRVFLNINVLLNWDLDWCSEN